MGKTTGIAWTDATWNPWEGCQNAGPGCDLCYAEARDNRWHGGKHFGPGAPRRRMVENTFRKPLAWNHSRAMYEDVGNDRWEAPVPPLWVFCLSLGDFLDNAVDPQWRADAWDVIRRANHLRFQIVTKRIGNLARMRPADWGDGSAYAHVGFIATVTSEDEFQRDGGKLRYAKDVLGVRWVGLSVEPMLAPLRLGLDDDWLDWVIIGGESSQGGARARPFDLAAAALLLGDCQQAGVPCFVKQMGSNPQAHVPDLSDLSTAGACHPDACLYRFRDKAGADISEWPAHLQVREMPRVYDAA